MLEIPVLEKLGQEKYGEVETNLGYTSEVKPSLNYTERLCLKVIITI